MTLIPVNVKHIQDKIADPNLGKKTEEKKPDPNRGAGADAAEARRKAREMAKTVEEKDALILQMQEENATAKKEAEEAKAKILELEPHAKNWSQYEHTRREKAIAKLPAEKRKLAKDWPLEAIETLAGVGASVGAGAGEKLDRSKMSDDEFAKLAESDPKKFLEMLDAPKA